MVTVKDVEKLNKEIEKINNERIKTETRKEMLYKSLNEQLEAYERTYGVKLSADSFDGTKKLILAEAEAVQKVVDAEYELKEKVVTALHASNYALAYELLGIRRESSDEEDDSEENVSNEVADDEVEIDLDENNLGDFSFNPAEEDAVEEDVTEEGISEDFGFGVESSGSPEDFRNAFMNMGSKEEKEDFGFGMQDDSSPEVAPEPTPTPVKPTPEPVKSKGFSFVVEDDTSDLEEDGGDSAMDFGFGDILDGSKFNL